jgi:acetyltransferase
MSSDTARDKVAALTTPRNVVVVGASDRRGSWATMVWNNLKKYNFQGGIYPLNPRRTEIWDSPCYPDFAALPEPPDHLAILVPASSVVEALKAGAAAGARSATIYSAGFGEAHDPEGDARKKELIATIAKTGLAVSGPNCIGNISGKHNLVTLAAAPPRVTVRAGQVALVGQSGGVMMFTNRVLDERGISVGYMISSGNEIGLSLADYITFFAFEPDVAVIVAYVEAIADVDKFKAACALAQEAGKPIIVFKAGQSEAGRSAAMAHTGALAGSAEVFDAVAGECGAIRVDTLDDAVELIEFLLRTKTPAGRRLGAITLSGAYCGVLLDAAEKQGLTFAQPAPQTVTRLQALLNVGATVGNPLDGGFGVLSSAETYMSCVEALMEDPSIDMLLLQEELPRFPGDVRCEKNLSAVSQRLRAAPSKPIAFISMITHNQTDHSRMLHDQFANVAFLNEANKGLRAIASTVRRQELAMLKASSVEPARAKIANDVPLYLERLRTGAEDYLALNELESKSLLASHGLAVPRENLCRSADEAQKVADAIGYPVVLKVVSAGIAHKSDVGGVLLRLRNRAEVAEGYTQIFRNLEEHGVTVPVEGVLVGQQIDRGLELVLGLHRDPEMGLVVMVGAGGVLLELMKDVAFAALPVSAAKAEDMLNRTRVSRLLDGYRGAAAFDRAAVVKALMGLGSIAAQLGDAVESIDINPFIALPSGEGGVAADALVILRNTAVGLRESGQ